METWKDIKGYEGRYQASSLGRVRSLEWDNFCAFSKRTHHVEQRILKTYKNKGKKNQTGSYVHLLDGGGQRSYYIHQLVAAAFFDDYFLNAGMRVSHIGDVNDNRPECLRIYNSIGCRELNGEYQKHYKGVKFYKDSGRYSAVVRVKGKNVGLGMFDTAEDASKAYLDAVEKYRDDNEQYKKEVAMIKSKQREIKNRRADERVRLNELLQVIKDIRNNGK